MASLRRTISVLVAALFAPAVSTAACSPFSAAEAPSVSPDGSSEAGTSDSATSDGDGGVSPDGSWCATHTKAPAKCFDFDSVPAPEQGWTLAEKNNGGVLELANEASSPPRAFRSKLPAHSGAMPQAALQFVLSPPVKAVTLSFDVALEQVDSCNLCDGALVQINQTVADTTHAVSVYVNGPRTYLQEYNSQTQSSASDSLSPPLAVVDSWASLVLVVDFEKPEATLTRNGGTPSKVSISAPHSTTTPVTIVVGLDQINDSMNAWSVRYDNVVIEAR